MSNFLNELSVLFGDGEKQVLHDLVVYISKLMHPVLISSKKWLAAGGQDKQSN